MTDFDDDIRRLLNEHVDAELGPRRPAPAFDPDRGARPRTVHRRVRTRWLPPLLAAACIAVIVGGSVATTQLLSSERNPAGPATPLPQNSAPVTVPVPTPSLTPTPTRRPATSTPSRTAVRPGGAASTGSSSSPKKKEAPPKNVVQLGAASIVLPAGWEARDLQRYFGSGGSPIAPGWCLTPSSLPVKKDSDACPVRFVQPELDGTALDVDTQGGFATNPHPCGYEYAHKIDHVNEERPFGGRTAEYRRWHDHCTKSPDVYSEQYVVPTVPAFILSAESGSDRYHDALTEIAAGSTLPAQTDPLPLVDSGFVRSVRHEGKSVRITLDRAFDGGEVNNNPATYKYKIGLSIWRYGNDEPKVGELVYLRTDGRRVLESSTR